MRLILLVASVIGCATLAGGQTNSARIAADAVGVGGRVTNREIPGSPLRRIDAEQRVTLRGDVTLTTDTAVIHADEAVVYPETNYVELQGKVTVQLLAPLSVSK
jgi:lipopolysaccharide export system protein LptA